MAVIERIQKLMDEQTKTRADLMRLSGLEKPTVYSLFLSDRKNADIRAETLHKIAKALNTTVGFLLTGEENALENLHTLFQPIGTGHLTIPPATTPEKLLADLEEAEQYAQASLRTVQEKKRLVQHYIDSQKSGD